MSRHEERELRLVHRIEAFSDLVMGFSLALLALSLVIPAHAISLLLDPVWLVSYAWTFATICSLWFNHQRLFLTYFVPTRFAVILNFLLLGCLVLTVYFVQVFLHVGGGPDRALALLLYFAAFAVTMMCMGSLYAFGTRTRWGELDGEERYEGVSRAARLLAVGVSILLGTLATPVLFVEINMRATATIAYAAIAGVLIARLALRYYKPRIIGSAHAAA